MRRALALFGAGFERGEDGSLTIQGTGGRFRAQDAPIDVGASGTALRFLTAVSTLVPGSVRLIGQGRLPKRPMADLLVPMQRLGLEVSALGARGRLPIEVRGGEFPGGTVEVSGRHSSQYVSALLMLGPMGKEDLTIRLRHRPVSEPYIRMTIDLMRRFGADVAEDRLVYRVEGKTGYRSASIAIEGDASNSSYYLALAAILGESLTITGIPSRSLQGDLEFLDLLEAMGCETRRDERGLHVAGGPLSGIEADLNRVPDLVPTLAVTALFASGRTSIRNVRQLRLKESDRLRALAIELRRIGARVDELPDGLLIERGLALDPGEVTFETHGDHRIAMSLAILGAAREAVRLADPGVVSKSYPGFFRDLFGLIAKRSS